MSIWRHSALFDDGGAPAARAAAEGWSLGEGDTPLQEALDLAKAAGVGRLLLKREDLEPGGSHKDRGLLYQVVRHRGDAPRTVVLSSSGNAAVSAAAACRLTGDRLVAFVSPGTPHGKRARLLASDAVVVETLKPINFGRYAARVFGLQDLRGTRDPIASIGYRSLAAEITAEAPEVGAVFTFSSSGISIDGVADGFERLGRGPALWAVQSGECIGLARALHPGVQGDPTSPAGRLGIRNPPHATALAKRLVDTGGGACVVRTPEVLEWTARLEEAGVRVSAEGGAVLAGVAAAEGLEHQTVVAVMTGARHDEAEMAAAQEGPDPVVLGSYLDVRSFFEGPLGLSPV